MVTTAYILRNCSRRSTASGYSPKRMSEKSAPPSSRTSAAIKLREMVRGGAGEGTCPTPAIRQSFQHPPPVLKFNLSTPMPATILDGNKIAAEIRAEAAAAVQSMTAAGVRPGLAVVLVGNNPASEIYVRGKVKSSEEVGIYSEKHTPPASITTGELLAIIADLNRRDEIDGILVQLPL